MTVESETSRALKIFGRVQGVGFRWWTRQQAQRLGLRGTVRNCRDGSVETVLAGDPDSVERMAQLLGQGPPSARVDRVSELAPPEEVPEDFRIVR